MASLHVAVSSLAPSKVTRHQTRHRNQKPIPLHKNLLIKFFGNMISAGFSPFLSLTLVSRYLDMTYITQKTIDAHTQHTSKLSVSYYRAIIAEAERPRNRNHLVTGRGLVSRAWCGKHKWDYYCDGLCFSHDFYFHLNKTLKIKFPSWIFQLDLSVCVPLVFPLSSIFPNTQLCS